MLEQKKNIATKFFDSFIELFIGISMFFLALSCSAYLFWCAFFEIKNLLGHNTFYHWHKDCWAAIHSEKSASTAEESENWAACEKTTLEGMRNDVDAPCPLLFDWIDKNVPANQLDKKFTYAAIIKMEQDGYFNGQEDILKSPSEMISRFFRKEYPQCKVIH